MGAGAVYAPYNRNLQQFTLQSREWMYMQTDPVVVPANSVASLQGGYVFGWGPGGPFTTTPFPGSIITVPQGGAIRIVKQSFCNCNISGAPGGTSLQCIACVIQLSDGGLVVGQPMRTWVGSYTGTVLGRTGMYAVVTDDEVIYAEDYAGMGGLSFTLLGAADVRNTDAVNPHDAALNGTVLIERWAVTTTARLRG